MRSKMRCHHGGFCSGVTLIAYSRGVLSCRKLGSPPESPPETSYPRSSTSFCSPVFFAVTFQTHRVALPEESPRIAGWVGRTSKLFTSGSISTALILSVSFTQPTSDSLISATRLYCWVISFNFSFVRRETSNPACSVSLGGIFEGIEGSILNSPVAFAHFSSPDSIWRPQRPPATASRARAPPNRREFSFWRNLL